MQVFFIFGGSMDHFIGINAQERYNNELMAHVRRQTELLEQIAQLLQPQQQKNGDITTNRKARGVK